MDRESYEKGTKETVVGRQMQQQNVQLRGPTSPTFVSQAAEMTTEEQMHDTKVLST
jgi:hypothetical protein